MKKYISPLLLIPILLTSCSTSQYLEMDQNNTKLEKQITETKEKKENDSFTKKQECYSKKNTLQKEYPDYTIDEVFYSPLNNTCYFTYYYTFATDSNKMERGVIDMFTSTKYDDFFYKQNEISQDQTIIRMNLFDTKISKLKGE